MKLIKESLVCQNARKKNLHKSDLSVQSIPVQRQIQMELYIVYEIQVRFNGSTLSRP